MKFHWFSNLIFRNAKLITFTGLALMLVGAYYSVFLYKNLKTDIEELLPTHARSGKDLAVLTDRLESIGRSKQGKLSLQIHDIIVHLIGDGDDAGIRLESPLGANHRNKFLRHIYG